MNVVFRVDASIHIGSGHVMRCLVLAKALNRDGARVTFACLPLPSDMRAYIEAQGFAVHSLTPPPVIIEPSSSADYLGWLQRSIEVDANDFLSCIDQADWVVTDHYAIDAEWQTIISSKLGCQILAIDDLIRTHFASLIVDQTLNREPNEYDSPNVVLAGTRFALLDERFSKKRDVAEKRRLIKSQASVLISMGGIDAPNATLKILKSLEALNELKCTVLLSERSPHFEEVRDWCGEKSQFTHIAFTNDMPSMMLNHDIAIGAPGSTSWERACLGLPNVIVPLADNQHEICRELVKAGAAVKVDIEDIEVRLPSAVSQVLENWDDYVQKNLLLCDGRGVERVVDKIMGINRENNPSMQ
ncbi:UDP-2,4-diacetamido-2,4,6-trideoxy-beta-L-altropyranose hydrolase [Vibrio breoganii]|uniref:UDP-2,4-diacetamido-2,4, 6-trideoxy-beta-L-altropyranose hydrolase n=1 Tax=Vibrio breoganii TaxID=553239 RepID=UPI000C84918F|nr:UDP-2,4-diacetamido-2,4,6-trideoxy-beta-L-altropyranose hydrolase [Vibrio breoganii]PMK74238.1 UDP-2,4-diacetamido-2,4,6-trideoxy-beta-L-altropyranose hydrolase [Vibrio breoganii]